MLAIFVSKPFGSRRARKATDETIFQKLFKEGDEELYAGMFNMCTGHFHKVFETIKEPQGAQNHGT